MDYLQKQKIQKQLSFFERLDYEVTEVREVYAHNGENIVCTMVNGNNKIDCIYSFSDNLRLLVNYSLLNIEPFNYTIQGVKSFKEFCKYFEK
jgi:dTDP-glucose pyrophosphorylase